jgi:hypothetical protein
MVSKYGFGNSPNEALRKAQTGDVRSCLLRYKSKGRREVHLNAPTLSRLTSIRNCVSTSRIPAQDDSYQGLRRKPLRKQNPVEKRLPWFQRGQARPPPSHVRIGRQAIKFSTLWAKNEDCQYPVRRSTFFFSVPSKQQANEQSKPKPRCQHLDQDWR